MISECLLIVCCVLAAVAMSLELANQRKLGINLRVLSGGRSHSVFW